MRCQKSLLHVYRSSSRLQLNLFTRHASSPRNFEPYVLPRHVIDLDAADSKYVRKADNSSATSASALIYREDSIEETQYQRNKKKREIGKAPIDVTKVNPADLWSYILLGCDNAPSKFLPTAEGLRLPLFTKARLQIITKRMGIDSLDSVEVAMAHFVDGFSIDATKNLQSAGFTRMKQATIRVFLRESKAWVTTRALVSMLSSTKQGCEFLARNGDALLTSLVLCRKAQVGRSYNEVLTPSMILRVLNNFRINASSKNVQIGAQLCNAALYYAGKDACLPAIKIYLKMAQSCKYAPPDWRARAALSRLLFALVRGRRGFKAEIERKKALELVTGWEGGMEPRAGQLRKPCFAYLAFKNMSQPFAWAIYPKYIVGLGDLGMTEAIYAEWMSPEPNRMDAILRGEEHRRFRSHMFAVAFLLADDPKRALQVLESVPTHHQDTSDTESQASNQWVLFCNMNTDDDVHKLKRGSLWLKAIILDHYKFHGSVPTPQLRIALGDSISNMPNDPQQALRVLQKMLLFKEITRNRSPGSHKSPRTLDWVKEDGEERIQLI
ncbi:hypothetical protein BUE80_DR006179 [Diplocarpon rosae]|nr:hypothetical protein BUE80_DR006179 [Diplocarpon rosae]